MNVTVNDPFVTVSLSRRNLLTLLHKLDRNEEEDKEAIRTLNRRCGDHILTVVAEEDDEHYQGRRPGHMGEDIEAKLAANVSPRDSGWPEED